eukprot:TRINITY_DN1472_c0_g3_i3.p1 TRINITY_DN1472_c0_g3~~TRINITY_DN1472_c0_g3_i3.p1  ORF type:complete len:1050 (+),score=479.25 TRINITY_DN1472_c0_g3_i3:511-3660(+)
MPILKNTLKEAKLEIEKIRSKDKESDNNLENYKKDIISLKEKHEEEIKKLKEGFEKEKNQMREQFNKEQQERDEDNDVDSLKEDLEMLTVDKELAEEKLENLQSELKEVKEKLELLEKEKKESEENLENIDESNLDQNAKAILEQNSKMKQALINLREVLVQERTKFGNAIQELKQENELIPDLQESIQTFEVELEEKKQIIENLQEALDERKDAEEMIEKLTEQKMNLQEKIQELETANKELEDLQEMSKEIEETQKEEEKRLRSQIHSQEIMILDKEGKIHNLSVGLEDNLKTINNYRQRVFNLTQEAKQYEKFKQEISEHESKLQEKQRELRERNILLENTVTIAKREELQKELHKLQAEQSNQQLSFILGVLPPTFFRNDFDCFSCLLLLRRLNMKSYLLTKYSNEMLETKVSEDRAVYLFFQNLKNILSNISFYLLSYESVLENSKEERYYQLGSKYSLLRAFEEDFNTILQLISQSNLSTSYSLERLDLLVDTLKNILKEHLGEEENYLDEWVCLKNELQNIFHHNQITFFNLNELLKSSKTTAIESISNSQSGFIEIYDSISEYLENEKNTEYTKEIRSSMEQALKLSAVISSVLFSTFENYSSFFGNIGSSTQDNLGEEYLQKNFLEILKKALEEKFSEKMDEEKYTGTLEYLQGKLEEVHKHLQKIQDNILIQDNKKVVKENLRTKFWDEKTLKIKEEVLKIMTYEEKIKSLKKVIDDHELSLSSKEKQILEEFRLQNVLKEKLEFSKKKIEELDLSIETKSGEIERLKVYEEAFSSTKLDNKKLQEELRNVKLQLLNQMKENKNTSTSNTPIDQENYSKIVEKNVSLYKDSIVFLTSQNRKLRSKLASKNCKFEPLLSRSNNSPLSFLRFDNLPSNKENSPLNNKIDSNSTSTTFVNTSNSSLSQLRSCSDELSKHLLSLQNFSCSPKVIDLNSPPPKENITSSEWAKNQFFEQNKKIQNLFDYQRKLQGDIHNVLSGTEFGHVETKTQNFQSKTLSQALNTAPNLVAKIHVPNQAPESRKVFASKKEIQQIYKSILGN